MVGIEFDGLTIVNNRCPRCSHGFRNLAAARNHLNQPNSGCRRRYELHLKCLRPVLNPNITLPPRRRKQPQAPFDSSDRPDSPEPMDTSPDDFANDTPDFALSQDVENSRPPTSTGEHAPAGSATRQQTQQQTQQPFYREDFAGAAATYGSGRTLLDRLRDDEFFTKRKRNPYYPYADRTEFEVASWISDSRMSMEEQNRFFRLQRTKRMGLSFKTAKDLRSRNEILPWVPEWKRINWPTKVPVKRPVCLLYRDPLECIQSILENPLAADSIHYTPYKLYRSAEKLVRVYTEWLSGDAAWSAQTALPPGATLLGTIISSDKTQISAMTGNRIAHPLLISLANLDMDYRNKATNNAFLLLALVPIPKFLHPNKRMCGLLEARLYHQVLDFVFHPVKIAASIGVMLNDPRGYCRYSFTPCAACIVDTPEATLVSCVAGLTASTTMADYTQFGDPFRHEPRTASTTIAQLQKLEETIDPWDIQKYFNAAKKFRLGGVHRPFWRDWALSDPSVFLTPEPLHHWHKMFWDHEIRWCTNVVGADQVDFRFSVLQPHTGYRHFKEGVSRLKQVTGREHRELQRYVVAIIAGTVPKDFLVAIRSLIDFRYLAQAPIIDDILCQEIEQALARFHLHKQSILDAGARRGTGNRTIDGWMIPKLEFMLSVVPSILLNGVPSQWSADTTEHAHITQVKNPARSTNNQNYETQICRYLDRKEKLRRFDLMTAIYASLNKSNSPSEQQDNVIMPVSQLVGARRGEVDYFAKANLPTAHQPPRTFTDQEGCTAFHLRRDPYIRRSNVHAIAEAFGLPDLPVALSAYIARARNGTVTHPLGGRRINGGPLPTDFANIEVWTRMSIQRKSGFYPHQNLPPNTLNATCADAHWPIGHCDNVILNIDPAKKWPTSGLEGHAVVQIRLIFRITQNEHSRNPPPDQFLAYVQPFDIVPQLNPDKSPTRGPYPEPSSSLYVLKRARRNGELKGEVVPVKQIRAQVDLVPRFKGKDEERMWTSGNVMAYSPDFWLNKYFDKELYHALR